MTIIKTDIGLKRVLNSIIALIIEDIAIEVLDKLQENIYHNTYNDFSGNNTYFNGTGHPTEQFYNAFRWNETKKRVNTITKELFYDYMSMDMMKSSDGFNAHMTGSGEDIRQELASMLDKDGFVAHKERKQFWKPTIEWLDDNFDNLVIKYAKKYGLKIER